MAAGASEQERRIERSENIIQYVLAVLVPSLMALMLYSFLLFDFLFTTLFVAVVAVALLALLPAMRLHRLHFETWARNTMPQKLITSGIGMIYIVAVSIFAVLMVSDCKGMMSNSPVTFAVFGGLLIGLMCLMAYSGRNKERFQNSEKRFFTCVPKALETHLVTDLTKDGHEYNVTLVRDMSRVELTKGGIVIRIMPLHGSMTEVLVENLSPENEELASRLKSYLDDVVLSPSSRLALDHGTSDYVRHT